jgi:hypothetical protein
MINDIETIDRNCESCRFFDDQRNDGWEHKDGWCRRFPPNTPTLESGQWHWFFSEVNWNDWCGEFVPSNTVETSRSYLHSVPAKDSA